MEHLLDKLVFPLKLILSIGIAISVANGVWFFFGGAQTSVEPPRESSAGAETREASETLAPERIASAHLFGQSAPGRQGQELAQVAAPETRLKLELQGVFLAEADERKGPSGAIVAESGQSGRLYRLGDSLPGGATLVAVFDNRILLRRGGQLETLRFVNLSAADGFVSNAPAPSNTNAGPPETAEQAPSRREDAQSRGSRQQGNTKASSDGTASLEARVERYSKQLRRAPQETLSELGVKPVEGGAEQGYRVGSNAPAAALARAGLRPGDVVLSVNGQPVGDIQADRQRLQKIVAQGTARLEIRRGDRHFFVTTRLR